jgi:hypothetical protein
MNYLNHIAGKSSKEKKRELDSLIPEFKQRGFRGEQHRVLARMFVVFATENRERLALLGIALYDFDKTKDIFLEQMEETRWAIEEQLKLNDK